jgi:hypothetical protein
VRIQKSRRLDDILKQSRPVSTALLFTNKPRANCEQYCVTYSFRYQPKLERHSLSALYGYLFSTSAVTTHTCGLLLGEGWHRVYLLRRPVTGLLYYDEYKSVAVGGMKIGSGNQGSRRKSALVTLRPPGIELRQLRYGTARSSLSWIT